MNSLLKCWSHLCSRERNIVERVQNIAPKFQDGLKAFADSPIIGEVIFLIIFTYKLQSYWQQFILWNPLLQIRGTGLILGTEFTDNKSPNDPFPSEWGNRQFIPFICYVGTLSMSNVTSLCNLKHRRFTSSDWSTTLNLFRGSLTCLLFTRDVKFVIIVGNF